MKTINILGYDIYYDDIIFDPTISKKITINTINPHCYCVAKNDQLYLQALHQSNILIPDGIGIVWAIKVLTGMKISRYSGSDLHTDLLRKMNILNGKIFYMGSSEKTLHLIQERVKIEFPNILTSTYSPPYKPVFTKEDNEIIISKINEFRPDVLFVGMTAPKQEKWAYQNQDHINTKLIASIGAVFDFYAGTVKRPGKLWIKLGLEWLPRLIKEPKRLWQRTMISTPKFIWDVLIEKYKA